MVVVKKESINERKGILRINVGGPLKMAVVVLSYGTFKIIHMRSIFSADEDKIH